MVRSTTNPARTKIRNKADEIRNKIRNKDVIGAASRRDVPRE
jgi:hypothetical protein